LFVNVGHDAKEIGGDELNKIVKSGDVKDILVVNSAVAEIYLKPEALKKDSLKKVSKNAFGYNNTGPHYKTTIGALDKFEDKISKLQAENPTVVIPSPRFETRINWLGPLVNYLLFPLGILALLWFLVFRQMGGPNGPGSQLFNIGRSRATLFDSKENGKVNVTFQDVAGLDEAKEEVMEVVDFLRTPKKYTALGAKIPKGVLLVGPPGTGKTLLAKAVAGEAGVPFFTLSGSDFVEMFVGVGASRVRDLFAQARAKAPCIIFIDEIDAIGRTRGRNSMNSNDERENTLNQLLVEMDGFGTDKGIILMAATNRADVLDQALLRPGRFDRQIEIDRPDIVGREQIFNVHLKNVKTASEVTASSLAEMTPGFAGADIANICNEAVLIAARRDKSEADMLDFNFALDRIIGGLEKKNKLIAPEEKNIIAYHEAGHAICGWFLEHAMPLVKVTIVPRGSGTLGYAQYLPKDEYITRTEALLDRMCMTLGGRAAESVMFDKISTGALSDLDQVTRMAYAMVAIYGMNERVGHVSFYEMQQQGGGFTKPYSEETSYLIDTECRRVIEEQYERAKALLKDKRYELELLAKELLSKEVLHKSDLERLIGPRPSGLKLI
ncbi:MAG: ATP-dependent zinc metalloprotease FtsH, partial [Bacteroidota bacterium]